MAGKNSDTEDTTNEFGFEMSDADLKEMDPHDRKALQETGGLASLPADAPLDPVDDPEADLDAKGEQELLAARAKPAATPPAAPAATPAAAPVAPGADAAALAAAAEVEAAAAAAVVAAEPSILGDVPDIAIPVVVPKAPADAAAQIATLQASLDDAEGKVFEGEMEHKDYVALKRTANTTIANLQAAVADDQLQLAVANTTAGAAWSGLLNSANGVLKASGLDPKNAEVAADLDMLIKTHAQRLHNAGETDGTNLALSRHALEKATAALLRMHGKAVGTPAAAPAAPAAKKLAPGASRIPDLSKLPPNLHAAPAAAVPGAEGGDPFAALDSLNDEDLELAVAKLSPADRDRYLGM